MQVFVGPHLLHSEMPAFHQVAGTDFRVVGNNLRFVGFPNHRSQHRENREIRVGVESSRLVSINEIVREFGNLRA
jgi:hypothetical protein